MVCLIDVALSVNQRGVVQVCVTFLRVKGKDTQAKKAAAVKKTVAHQSVNTH